MMKMGRTGVGYLPLLFLLLLWLIMLCYSCREFRSDPVQDFIPGTYIRFSQHEFGTEYDTLLIEAQSTNADAYTITRRWKYERVLDGVLIEPEYKLTVTTGFYESARQWLRENESGDIFIFELQEKCLFNGPVKYQKL